MTLTISFVFVAVFLSVLLVYTAFQAERSARQKKTSSRLADIASGANQPVSDDEVDSILLNDSASSLPWLDRILKPLGVTARAHTLLVQADSRWSVETLLLYSSFAGGAAFLLAFWRTAAVWPSLVLGCVACFGPLGYVLRQRASRFEKFEQRLPEALDMMVSAIRAGHGILSAIGSVAKESPEPVSTEFRKCFDEQNFGLAFRTAMQNLALRVPLHDVQIVVTAILIQKESGGNLAEIIEKVAYIIRERFRLKRQIRVHTAQGRLTGWILTLLPVVLGCGIFLVNPEYIQRLWQNEMGVKLLYTSAVMTVLGGLIIRKIINVRI
jgi:tight adherence protein B